MPSASGSSLAGPAGEFLHPGSAAVPREPEAKKMPRKKSGLRPEKVCPETEGIECELAEMTFQLEPSSRTRDAFSEQQQHSSCTRDTLSDVAQSPNGRRRRVPARFSSQHHRSCTHMGERFSLPERRKEGEPRDVLSMETDRESTDSSDRASSRRHGYVPCRGRVSDYCSDIVTEPSDNESVHASATPIVLPAMSGPELVGTLKGMQATDDALYDPVTFHNQVTSCTVGPSIDMLECQDFYKEEIREAMLTAGVSYAGGESDDDSIRDQEDGPHRCLQWHRRKPYFFRREPNLNDVRYRRRMKVKIGCEAGKRIEFEPDADSDKDGYVKQESFHVQATRHIDETGNVTDLPAEGIQDYVTDGATKIAPVVFPGYHFRKEQQIADEVKERVEDPRPELQAGSRRDWLESVKDKTPQEVLDNLSLLIKLGVDRTTHIGKVRALQCVDCGDTVEGSIRVSWVCDDCEEFVCTDCRSLHLTKHISATLQKGLELHEGHLEAVRRKQLSTETERRIPDPEPEIDETDPLSAFFATRDKKPKHTGPSTAQATDDRCESSDEGEFAAVDWCSICGSETCQLTVRECSSSKKLEKTVLALQVMCNDATLCDWETKVGAEKLQAENLERVAGRRELKATIRDGIDKRRSEGGWKRLNELASKDKCIGRNLSVGRRRVLHQVMFEGVTPGMRRRSVQKAAAVGFEYMKGGAADSVQRTGAQNSLRLAIAAMNSSYPASYRKAKKHAENFLANCPSDMLNTCMQELNHALEKMLAVRAESLPPEAAEGSLADATQNEVYRMTLQRHPNGDAHVRVWRRYGRLQQRAKEHRVVREEAAYAEVLKKLGTHNAGARGAQGIAQQRDAKQMGLAANLTQVNEGTAPHGHVGRAKQLKKERDNACDEEIEDKLLPPGTWRCSSCHKANFPSTIHCGGWVNKQKVCQGSQHETFGGYIVLPAKPLVIRPETMNSSKLRSSISRAAQTAKLKTESGFSTAAACRAQLKIHNKRRGIIDKHKQTWAEAMAGDPSRWECQYCYKGRGGNTVNGGDRTDCYKCSQPGPPVISKEELLRLMLTEHREERLAYERYFCDNCSDPAMLDDAQMAFVELDSMSSWHNYCPKCETERVGGERKTLLTRYQLMLLKEIDREIRRDCNFPDNVSSDEEPPPAAAAAKPKARKKRPRGGKKKSRKTDGPRDDESLSEHEEQQREMRDANFVRIAQTADRRRSMTEAERAREGLSRSSGVACKTPYAHNAQSATAAAATLLVAIGISSRVYQTFDVLSTAVESSASGVIENVGEGVQGLSTAIFQMISAVAVTVICVYLERFVREHFKWRESMREAYSPLMDEDDSPQDDDICPRPCTRCGIYQCAFIIKHEGEHNCLDCSRDAPWKEPKPIKPAPKQPPPVRPPDEHFSRVPLAGPCELTSAEYATAMDAMLRLEWCLP